MYFLHVIEKQGHILLSYIVMHFLGGQEDSAGIGNCYTIFMVFQPQILQGGRRKQALHSDPLGFTCEPQHRPVGIHV